MYKTLLFCTLSFVFLFGNLSKGTAQGRAFLIHGRVVDENNKPIEGVYVYISDQHIGVYSDPEGYYEFRFSIPSEYCELSTDHINYEAHTERIFLKGKHEIVWNIQLISVINSLENLLITTKTQKQRIEESEYAVHSIDVTKAHYSGVDVEELLNRGAGIRVLHDGGLGSASNIVVNGLSGNQVKVFVDGIPIEGYGPSFQLNNIAVNTIERIDVYKGVVPPFLGADALGGAINIISNKSGKNYLDLSYAHGSFNTHRTALNGALKNKNGFSMYVNAYQNYSDNAYKVNVKILDLESSTYSEDKKRVKRFHDTYRNEAVQLRLGVENKPYADQLLFGFLWGQVYDEIQHAADMDKVFGDKYRESESLIPSIVYHKRNLFTDGLALSFNASHNFGKSSNKDLGERRYNWLGESRKNTTPGEQRYSDYHYRNNNGQFGISFSYRIEDRHIINLDNSLQYFDREGEDRYRVFFTKLPTKTLKNIAGLSYRYQLSENWSATLFYKKYYNKVDAYYSSQDKSEVGEFSNRLNAGGGGGALTYLYDSWQLKASYERAQRLPTARELFGMGDGIEEQNVNLKSESSSNLNLSMKKEWQFSDVHTFSFETNYALRQAKDFINRRSKNGIMRAENFGTVKINTLDVALNYRYKHLFAFGAVVTYQDIRNKQKYIEEEGQRRDNYFYNERLPNLPYFFFNTELTFYLNRLFTAEDKMEVAVLPSFVESFTNDWDSYSSSAEVPSQFVVDFSVLYRMNATYSLSLEARDLFDVDRFDNYNLQKPGRSFALKIRMYLNQK